MIIPVGINQDKPPFLASDRVWDLEVLSLVTHLSFRKESFTMLEFRCSGAAEIGSPPKTSR